MLITHGAAMPCRLEVLLKECAIKPLEPVGLSYFGGGWSVDPQFGSRGQFYYSRHIDFRKKPRQFSVLPGGTNVGEGVVTDLIEQMVKMPNGENIALGDAGNLYRVTTAGVFSNIGNIGENGGAGLSYRPDVDMLYAAGTTKVARMKYMTTSGAPDFNFFAFGRTTTSTCYKTGGTNTYTLPASVLETATAMRTFVADIEPFYKIGVNIVDKGTGNWTLTLHDDANTLLASTTVTNANLKSGINYFTFSSPVRALVSPNGRTYHFHLSSTVGDGIAATTTASSLSDCDMELHASALISTKNGLHPMMQFANFTLIGNERYVSSYEPLQDSPTTADFQRHRLTLPPGYEVCSFAQLNLFALIGAEKRSDSGEFQEGKIFLWDGIQTAYNDYWDIPEGSPEALFSQKNLAQFIAGGSLYRTAGQQPVKIRTLRGTDSEFSNTSDTTHVNPNMMTVRRGVLLIGYPTSTTNQSLEHAVYSSGSISREFPESFGYNYSLSTGTRTNNGTNNLRIGMVKNFGDTLYTSWRDESQTVHTYGIDRVDNSSSPAATFTIESLYFDNSQNDKYGALRRKRAARLIATFKALPSGTSLQLKYKIDGATSWTTGDAVSTVNYTYMTMDVSKQFFGIEFGIDGTVSGTTPEILSLYLLFDPHSQEDVVLGNG